jgi:hypothetical protein
MSFTIMIGQAQRNEARIAGPPFLFAPGYTPTCLPAMVPFLFAGAFKISGKSNKTMGQSEVGDVVNKDIGTVSLRCIDAPCLLLIRDLVMGTERYCPLPPTEYLILRLLLQWNAFTSASQTGTYPPALGGGSTTVARPSSRPGDEGGKKTVLYRLNGHIAPYASIRNIYEGGRMVGHQLYVHGLTETTP